MNLSSDDKPTLRVAADQMLLLGLTIHEVAKQIIRHKDLPSLGTAENRNHEDKPWYKYETGFTA